ncbi:MAG: hypothetical protein GXX85_07610, partial [Ignavibacteria bacterium]|nr:hypothetical protein [Ignavibacteria bacterium]
MTRIYKYGFWLFLICTLTIINLYRLTKNGCEQENSLCKDINEKRISSLMLTNTIMARKINPILGENLITNKKEEIFNENTLVILLSDFTCNACQADELKRIELLKDSFKSKNISIIAVTTKDKIGQVITQRKIAKIDYPMYWVDNAVFKNNISFANIYPQIMLIKNNQIVSSFIPVPK